MKSRFFLVFWGLLFLTPNCPGVEVYPGLSDIKQAKFSQRIWGDDKCDGARAGLQQLMEGPSMEIRVPAKVFVAAIKLGSIPRGANEQYEKLGFVPSPEDRSGKMNALLGLNPGAFDFPLGFTVVDENRQSGTSQNSLDGKYVSISCLMCHSGLRANQVVIGAANQNFNPVEFLRFVRELDEKIAFFVYLPFVLTSEERQDLVATKKYLETFFIPSFTAHSKVPLSRGMNLAPLTDGLMLVQRAEHPRYPFEVSYAPLTKEYQALAAGTTPPAQPHAWFAPRYGMVYRWGEDFSAKGENALPHFTNFRRPDDLPANATNGQIETANERTRQLMESTQKIYGLVKCVDSPPYPGRIDQKKADQGCALYNRKACAGCHGTLKQTSGGWKVGTYQPRFYDVGTDPIYRAFARKVVDHYRDNMPLDYQRENDALIDEIDPEKKFTDDKASVSTFPGAPSAYQPRPLVGIWARAPFTHNGQVPDVETMMTRQEDRPRYYWIKDPTAYNFTRLGMDWEPLDEKTYQQFLAEVRAGKRDVTRLINTTISGRSNQGHSNVGQQIVPDAGERHLLLECLKTLNVP